MWEKSFCGFDDVFGGVDGCGEFGLFDLFAGVSGVFEFGSASAEGAVGGEVVAELGADGVFDAEVSAFLGGSEALVGEDADEGEAGGVVGGGVGGFGVGVGYEGGSGEFGASGGDPAVTRRLVRR